MVRVLRFLQVAVELAQRPALNCGFTQTLRLKRKEPCNWDVKIQARRVSE